MMDVLTTLLKQMKIALCLLLFFTLLTGIIYPALVTVIAQLVFPWQANGSLIEHNGTTVGSYLIGQSFTDPSFFWGRPSDTEPMPYNASYSHGSNQGPNDPTFLMTLQNRIMTIKHADPNNAGLIPVDLVTASGSGLDPDISPASADYQVARIAQARNIPESDIRQLIMQATQKRFLNILGEPRVNVLQLNIALLKRDRFHENKSS